jgi:hypothetical protein
MEFNTRDTIIPDQMVATWQRVVNILKRLGPIRRDSFQQKY